VCFYTKEGIWCKKALSGRVVFIDGLQLPIAIFALIDEPDVDKNECASITGLSCFPNKAAVFKMIKHVGFSDVIQLQPHNQAFEQYATFDRIILLAKV